MSNLRNVNHIVSAVLASFLCAPALAQTQQEKIDEYMTQRTKSAQEIIAQSDEFNLRAERLNKTMENEIAQATKLKGEANYLHSVMPVLPAKTNMTPAQLQAAQDMYKAHVEDFKLHTIEYQKHLDIFKKTVGECHANENTYQALVAAVQLHIDQFHMNMPVATIRPPHVCGMMRGSAASAASAAGQIRSNMQRVVQSETQLAQEESRLQNVEMLSAPLDNKVAQSAIRANQEKAIYGEFGRLRDEYTMLQTEKDVLATTKGSGGKLTSTAVAGQIKH